MRSDRAASRYARAVYELARETGRTEALIADLAGLSRMEAASPAWAAFRGDYTLGRAARRRALEALLASRLAPLTWNFLQLLEEKRRLDRLPRIIRNVLALHDAASGRIQVRLRTAREWEPGLRDQLAGQLERRTGQAVELQCEVRGELLGGFEYELGDQLHDYSVAGALRAFRDEMAGTTAHARGSAL